MNTTFYRLLIGVFLIGAIVMVPAQKSDAKSRQILDAVAQNYKAKKNSYFKFSYGTGTNGRVTKTETGFFYSTPSQYKLKIMGTEQIFDGSKVYSISEEDQEVTVAKANGTQMMFSPTNYLETYKKDYNTTYVGKENLNGVASDLIKLTPIKNNGLKSIYIFVNQPKRQILKIEQYSADDSVAVIAVKEYKANQNLASGMFQFNRSNYKNYIITEL